MRMTSGNTIAKWKLTVLMDNIKTFVYLFVGTLFSIFHVNCSKDMNESLTRPHLKRVKHTHVNNFHQLKLPKSF